ncbi:hypothetical protein L0156_04300 [bacterium]|nr:hypothetical protein [bacterium]
MKKQSVMFAFLMLAVSLPYLAFSETVNCTAITSVPYTINTPGVYCFRSNWNFPTAFGNMVTINASGVVIDLNGYTLSNQLAGPATSTKAFYANEKSNIVIKNGEIRYFYTAIDLSDSRALNVAQTNTVEGIRAIYNTHAGIWVAGMGHILRKNEVSNTGVGSSAPDSSHFAIRVGQGFGARVLNNEINLVAAPSGAYGIYFANHSHGLAVGNRITSTGSGITYFSSTGKYRDTLTSGVTTPYSGGTNAGNNQ